MPTGPKVRGKVKKLVPDRGFGFVRGDDGKLRAPEAAALFERMTQDGDEVKWALEQRVDVVTVARSRRD